MDRTPFSSAAERWAASLNIEPSLAAMSCLQSGHSASRAGGPLLIVTTAAVLSARCLGAVPDAHQKQKQPRLTDLSELAWGNPPSQDVIKLLTQGCDATRLLLVCQDFSGRLGSCRHRELLML